MEQPDTLVQLDRLIELAGRHARLVLVEFQRRLMPAWLLMPGNGKIQIVGTPWTDEKEKHRYTKKLRFLMRKNHVLFYSFVSEAWTAMLEPGEWDKESGQPRDGVRPAERPDRQEIVIACAASKELVRWRQWRIVREATTERIIDLKEKPFPESQCQPKSWMAEMLK
jgi:hypothetical protein